MTPEEKQSLSEAIADLAHSVAHYYLELVRCGMDEQRAFDLTVEYQLSIIGNDLDLD